MKPIEVKITKDTQVGFGWIAFQSLAEEERRPAGPDFTGTVTQVVNNRTADRAYMLAMSSSAILIVDWFVSIAGEWKPIEFTDRSLSGLYKVAFGKAASVTVKIREVA
jgi:hypothetical protein